MNVLLIGSGGREHALAWSLAASPLLTRLYAAPGNPGIAAEAQCVPLDTDDHAAVIAFCAENKIGLVVIGPEAPLVAGLVDRLAEAGIKAFGPTAAAARLEGSKAFTKELCKAEDIPTAGFARFADADAACAYLRGHPAPIVVKADGLAAGKGVVVAITTTEAEAAARAILGGGLGAAGAEIVIEEFLQGEEASLFCLVHGEQVLVLGSAQDHKRAFDGDRGPNTGGMGAYSPAPVMTAEMTARAVEEIVRPTARALARAGTPYVGVLYAGLIMTADGPKLIEYNVRFGDPETQVLVPRLRDDLLTLLLATVDGALETMSVRMSDAPALTVVMAARGYPEAPQTGGTIEGLERAEEVGGVLVFQAGTRLAGDDVVAAGGRVLNVTATGASVTEARARAYSAVDRIQAPSLFCRRDIGWRAIAQGL